MRCPRCGSDFVQIQAVTEVRTKHRGCFGWLLWILLAVVTVGLILIIPLLTNSSTRSEEVVLCLAARESGVIKGYGEK